MLKPARTALAVFSLAVFLISGTPSFAQEKGCFLSASQTTIEVGDIIFWRLETDGFGSEARAYWTGNYQGGQYIPELISDYQEGKPWEKSYFYGDAKPGRHTRFVEIKAKDGVLLCRTSPVEITVKEREKIKIGPIPLPIEKQKPKLAKVDPAFGAPIAQKCEASFSVSCNPNTLKINWNLGSGETCNIFIRSDTGDYSISNNCSGSTQISEVGGQQIQEGGNYKLFVSNGKESDTCYNELKSQVKIYCSGSQGGEQTQSKPTPEVKCSLTPSQQLIKMGGKINWGIRSTDYGTSAEWAGKDNGQDISPAPVEKYPPLPGQEWSVQYEYKEPSEYLRFVRIKQKIGDKEETICTTDAVTVNITKTGELISAGGQAPKTITGITINGQVLDIKNPGRIKIDFPKAFSRGDTQTVPIIVTYSDGTNLTKNFTFQSKLSGTVVSGEQSYSQGEPCEAKNYHWLTAAKDKDGPAPLYCRVIEGVADGQGQWITAPKARDLCNGKRGITALAGDGNGGAVTFYCNGQDWVDERTWLAFQQNAPQGPQTPEQQTERPAGGPTPPVSPSAPSEPSAVQPTKKNVFDLCDASIPCLPGVDNAAGGEKLYCRQIGGSTNNQYMYVTAKYAKDQCSPTQTGRTALCGGQTYRCDGTTWQEVQASGDQAQRSVRKILLSFSGGGQVEVTSGQQIRIPLSGEGRVTITIEYSDRTVTKTFIFRPPRGQEQPQPVQPQQPQVPACPNSGDKICADSEGCTPDKSMKCGGYLGQYTNSQGTLGCSSQYYCWFSCRPAQAGECGRPAAAPQPEPQLRPQSAQPTTPQVQEPAPQQPAAPTCPGTCANSNGLTKTGKQCDAGSWQRDNHSCESDSVDFYCYASCP